MSYCYTLFKDFVKIICSKYFNLNNHADEKSKLQSKLKSKNIQKKQSILFKNVFIQYYSGLIINNIYKDIFCRPTKTPPVYNFKNKYFLFFGRKC